MKISHNRKAILLVLIAVGLLFFSASASAQSISIVSPTQSLNLKEGADFATVELHNPWDFEERRDMGLEFDFEGSSVRSEQGKWKATMGSSGTPRVLPLFGGYYGALAAEGIEGDRSLPALGINHPVNTSKYSVLSYRLKTSNGGLNIVRWDNDTSDLMLWPKSSNQVAIEDGFYSHTEFRGYDNWKIRSIDLADDEQWTNSVYTIEIEPAHNAGGGTEVQFDWVRLVDPDSAPTIEIKWQADNIDHFGMVTLFVDMDDKDFNGSPIAHKKLFGDTSGSFEVKSAILPPGKHYFYVEVNDAASFSRQARSDYSPKVQINSRPAVTFTAPTTVSGEDYASSVGVPWDMSGPEDTPNLNPLVSQLERQFYDAEFSNGMFSATCEPPYHHLNKPHTDCQLHLQTHPAVPIDTYKYCYMTYRIAFSWSDHPTIYDQHLDGAISRVLLWDDNVEVDGVRPVAHFLYEGWHTYTYDLCGNNTGMGLYNEGLGVPYRSRRHIKRLRFDPVEQFQDNKSVRFHVDWVTFTSENYAEPTYNIIFNVEDQDDEQLKFVRVYWDVNDSGYDGKLIANYEGVSPGTHTALFDGTGLGAGKKIYFYVVVDDGKNLRRKYAPVHVVLGGAGAAMRHVDYDFDGDQVADRAIFRPSAGTFWLNQSSSGVSGQIWGLDGDRSIDGDFDGDGKSDLAVIRLHPNGMLQWFIRRSSDGMMEAPYWGYAGDIPVIGDYNGDMKDEIAVWRNGLWIIRYGDNGVHNQYWGVEGDIPAPADYDGDGTTDLAIYRPSDAYWWVINSGYATGKTARGYRVEKHGDRKSIPVPGDYNGDGADDFATFNPRRGEWKLDDNGDNISFTLGKWGDFAIAADFNGDGIDDPTVIDSNTFVWEHYLGENVDRVTAQWGWPGDQVP